LRRENRLGLLPHPQPLAELCPVVTEADTDEIIRSLRDKAKAGDLGAARELREWVEIRKEDEGRSRDKRLLELLSAELRDAIAEELYGDVLPASCPHEALT